MKQQVKKIGDNCRHCQIPVIRSEHSAGWKPKPEQPFYYEWWLKCPNCNAVYMTEEGKITLKPVVKPQIDTSKLVKMMGTKELSEALDALEKRVAELERKQK